MGSEMSSIETTEQNNEDCAKTEFFPFQKLQPELQHIILDNLALEDLLTCRRVSKFWKEKADIVMFSRSYETSLSRGRKMTVKRWLNILQLKKDTVRMMHYRCSFKILRLSINFRNERRSVLKFTELLEICKQNLDNVKSLIIDDVSCTNKNCKLISQIFPLVKTLKLCHLELDNKSVSSLFESLECLTKVVINYLPINGSAFEGIADRIEIIEWKMDDITSFVHFPYTETLRSFNLFVLSEVTDFVFRDITKKMPNLEELFIEGSYVETFKSLKLQNLRTLKLKISEVVHTSFVYLRTVTRLKLIIQRIDFRYRAMFSQFPNLKVIDLEGKAILTLTLINALRSVHTLQYFSLNETVDSLQEYLLNINGKPTNVLEELISSLLFTQIFQVNIKCNNVNEKFSVLHSAVKPLFLERTTPNVAQVSVELIGD